MISYILCKIKYWQHFYLVDCLNSVFYGFNIGVGCPRPWFKCFGLSYEWLLLLKFLLSPFMFAAQWFLWKPNFCHFFPWYAYFLNDVMQTTSKLLWLYTIKLICHTPQTYLPLSGLTSYIASLQWTWDHAKLSRFSSYKALSSRKAKKIFGSFIYAHAWGAVSELKASYRLTSSLGFGYGRNQLLHYLGTKFWWTTI